jgi:hypothetical protein
MRQTQMQPEISRQYRYDLSVSCIDTEANQTT